MSFFEKLFKKKNKVPKLNLGYLQRHCGITASAFREITSTNAILKEYARQGAPNMTTVVAESQTEGKGRGEHTFFSPLGTGVYISILLLKKDRSLKPADITAAAGVAACEAIEAISDKECSIKWMNDVYVEGKKVAGILCESGEAPEGRYVVVGAGFNLFTPPEGFPEEIAHVAGSLFGEGDKYALREKLAVVFFRKLEKILRASSVELYRHYRDRLFIIGRKVMYEGGVATVSDLASDFRLELTMENGEKRFLDSGEITLSEALVRES